MSDQTARPIAGILWMAITGVLFVCVTALVKYIGTDVPAAQGAFVRYLLGLVFLIPMIKPILSAHLTKRQIGLFALRGGAHGLAVVLWFFAMARIPVADVTAMNYLSPVYVSIGAALFLGERLPPRRLAAVVAALVGAFIILRPGLRELDPGHFAVLGTAILFAASYLFAKQLSGEVSPTVIVGMLSVTVTIVLAPMAWSVWVPVSWSSIGLLFIVACIATAGHYTMTFAFAAAPMTVTQPVTFLQLVWAVLLGYFLFNEAIDGWVIFGGAVIMAAVSFITWREARAKRAIIPAVHATKS